MGKVQSFLINATDEELGRFIRMFMRGHSYEEIGEAFSISTAMAQMVKRALNSPSLPQHAPLTEAQQKRKEYYAGVQARWHEREQKKATRVTIIREMKASGKTYAQIGKQMGVSRQRIQQLIAFSREEREELMARAGKKCEDCGTPYGKLDTHHTDYIKNEGIVLCVPCHKKANVLQEAA